MCAMADTHRATGFDCDGFDDDERRQTTLSNDGTPLESGSVPQRAVG
jgi:hypothetical protein